MEYLNCGLTDFTERLASSAPVPGGGGAAALAGALGVALGAMVGNLTAGKKKYAAVEAEVRALTARAEDLRRRLLDCIGKDAAAFEPLSRAYGIPKDAPERAEVLEGCLREAASAPLEILDLCCEALDLLREFAAKGSVLVRSDAASGAALCRGALYAAAMNVRVNTALMHDRAYAEELDARTEERLAAYGELAQKIFDSVYRGDTDG